MSGREGMIHGLIGIQCPFGLLHVFCQKGYFLWLWHLQGTLGFSFYDSP